MSEIYLQRDQPEGVPPLALTGERTLPDIPQENYWYRRHEAVYNWIAPRIAGLRVIDMACGEGYGAAVLAKQAASVVGVDANPEAFEHARLRYATQKLSFARDLVGSFDAPCDAITFLQTIEHVEDPGALLDHFCSLLGRYANGSGEVAYISTPNLVTLAGPDAQKSENPWHVREYRAQEYMQLCCAHFSQVELFGLFHARKLRVHEWALRLGWDHLHKRLGITDRFYAWFTPAISASDFKLVRGGPEELTGALDFIAVCRP